MSRNRFESPDLPRSNKRSKPNCKWAHAAIKYPVVIVIPESRLPVHFEWKIDCPESVITNVILPKPEPNGHSPCRVWKYTLNSLKAQTWTTQFAALTIADGQEDSADVYLRGSESGWLLLMCAHHYDAGDWRLDAYESPERSFARPANETFEAYMQRSIAESLVDARPFRAGPKPDGVYFFE